MSSPVWTVSEERINNTVYRYEMEIEDDITSESVSISDEEKLHDGDGDGDGDDDVVTQGTLEEFNGYTYWKRNIPDAHV